MPAAPSPETERSGSRAAPLPPAERREAIITAVLPLLRERGASVTSRELAQAAGVSEGTIFKAFTDKDDLFAAALARVVDPAALEQAIRAIDPSLPFEQRLAKAVTLMQHRLVDIWTLLTKLPPASVPTAPRGLDDSAATIALFTAEAHRLRLPPVQAARRFRAIVLALSHPLMYVPALKPAEIVDQFLNGAAS